MCGVTTNALNKVFMNIGKEIKNILIIKKNILRYSNMYY